MPKDTGRNTEPEPRTATSRYNTRKMDYKYSNTQAPYTPAPPRNKTCPPLPVLASRRKKAQEVVEEENGFGADAEYQPDPCSQSLNVSEEDSEPSSHVQPPFECGSPDLQAIPEDTEPPNPQALQAFAPSTDSNRAHVTAAYTSVSAVASATLEPPAPPITTIRSPIAAISTPRRSNPSVTISTPAVVIFGQPPPWAVFGGDRDSNDRDSNDHDSHFPPFASITSVPLDLPGETNLPQSIALGQSNPPSPTPLAVDPFHVDQANIYNNESGLQHGQIRAPEATFFPLGLPSIAQNADQSVSTPAGSSTQLALTRPQPRGTSFASLRDAVMQSIPPATSSALVLASAVPSAAAPPPNQPIHAHNNVHRATYNPRQTVRQSTFTYDQVVFINTMAKRWAWFLATEDCFPANVYEAKELCIAYAESILLVPRIEFTQPDLRQMFGFVQNKESGIRNGFLTGLLLAVETSYGISNKEADKSRINELIKDANFIYIAYDANDKSAIKGRYRHTGIVAVLKLLLFRNRFRGQPLGVCFIHELMADSPAELVQQFNDKTATTGAPVGLIALAATLILYALQSIRAGDSSSQPPKSLKPINFTEKTYHLHYRKFLANIKGYLRLSSLRKFHMERIMQDYLSLQPGGDANDLDMELELDDGTERFSDGE